MRRSLHRLFWLVAVAACHWPLGQVHAYDPYNIMVDNGPSSNRVDIVFLGDGYIASQIDTDYVSHIQNTLDHMFLDGQHPFPRYQNFFNVHRVNVASNESGADVPSEAIERDTALDATYSFMGGPESDLYIDPFKGASALSDGLMGAGFSAEMRPVSVNYHKYGGASGAFSVYAGGYTDTTIDGPEIALHEIGHSFSDLADEYFDFGIGTYSGPEPDEVNITTNSSGDKWTRWLGYNDPDDNPDLGEIGAWEGADGYAFDLYRPSEYSKMRELGYPFDAVSREKIILDIYSYVDPLDDWLKTTDTLVDPDSLWVDVVDTDVIQMEWYVNGELAVGATGESFNPLALGPGSYTIEARAKDNTPWVHVDTIGRDALKHSVEWSVDVVVPEPTTLLLAGMAALVLPIAALRRRSVRRRASPKAC